MHPTLTPHRNVLAELVIELEREGHEYARKADDAARGRGGDSAYFRGAQDAHANIVGRLNSILGAHLTAIIDFAEVYDDLERRLLDEGRDGAYVPRIVAETLDTYTIGGRR